MACNYWLFMNKGSAQSIYKNGTGLLQTVPLKSFQ